MIYIPEEKTELDPFTIRMQSVLLPGEIWITNAVDINRPSSKKIPGCVSGQQMVDDYKRLGDKNPWESVRVVSQAFDKNGKLIPGMVAVVGKPKP